MKLWITGASGFLGQYVVAAALRQGHEVMAVVRPHSKAERLSWHEHPRVQLVRADLRQRRGLEEALTGADAVIHLAAVKSGDFYTQFAGTVLATENLLSAMVATGINQLIAISTFSLYDYINIKPWKLLDEHAPLVQNPKLRDEYTQTKLIQERLYRDFEQEQQAKVTILRPGMVYGRDNLWHSLIGAKITDRHWLRIGGRSILPMTYVENCAEAIALAASSPAAVGQTLNIVDDQLPTQHAYTEMLLRVTAEPPTLTKVSWANMRLIAWLAGWVNRRFCDGKARLPGIFVSDKIHARFKPLRYSNQFAKQLLGWQPRYSFDQAVDRSCGQEDLVAIAADIPTGLVTPQLTPTAV